MPFWCKQKQPFHNFLILNMIQEFLVHVVLLFLIILSTFFQSVEIGSFSHIKSFKTCLVYKCTKPIKGRWPITNIACLISFIMISLDNSALTLCATRQTTDLRVKLKEIKWMLVITRLIGRMKMIHTYHWQYFKRVPSIYYTRHNQHGNRTSSYLINLSRGVPDPIFFPSFFE